MIRKKSIKELDIEKKNILIRIDIDCSFNEGSFFSTLKVARYKDVFKYLQSNKAKVVVLFDFGKNRVLYPCKCAVSDIVEEFSELIDCELNYFSGKTPKDIDYALEEVLPAEILVWENLALTDEEQKNNSPLFEKFINWAELYVNDAFSISARDYYSFKTLLTKIDSFSGILLAEEINKTIDLIEKMSRPLTLVLGGLRVEPFMLEMLLKLADKADNVLLTGAWVSFAAWAHKHVSKEYWADKKTFRLFEKNVNLFKEKENILLPEDVIVYKNDSEQGIKTANVPIDFIKAGLKIGDIGKKACEDYAKIIEESKMILWYGAVGKWWKDGLFEGTLYLAEKISRKYADKILIGDDLIESLDYLGFEDFHRFDLVHYGDGKTFFNFLLQQEIVGVEKLKNSWNI